MKNSLFLKATLFLIMISGAFDALGSHTYFVAVDGNDSNEGSIEKPFASLRKAQSLVEPGDTVYIREGVYKLSNSDIMGVEENLYNCVFLMDKDGSRDARICYFGYPGEKCVFDLSEVVPSEGRVSAFFVKGSWLHFKNFEVVGTHVIFSESNTQSECFSNRGGCYNIYECLSMHDGEAIGFYLTKGSDNLVLNCDAYRNWEVTMTQSGGGRGGNVDGFGAHPALGGTGNVFRGCRAWFNADDGFDLINSAEAVLIDSCWAFYNGFKPIDDSLEKFESLADGNGIKAGGYGMNKKVRKLEASVPMHKVTNSIAYRNKASGFYANHHLGGVNFTNNTSYANRFNYNMVCRKSIEEIVDVDGYDHVLVGNIGYKATSLEVRALDEQLSHIENCVFGDEKEISDADFKSLDYNMLTLPRLSDGALPAIDFLSPAPGSNLFKTRKGHTFPAQ